MAAHYLKFARFAFDFQRKEELQGKAPIRGFSTDPDTGKPVALFHSWYGLIGERRANRNDFLKALIRSLNVDTLTMSVKEDDVHFARFVADNLSTFEYKTAEEVFVVVEGLKTILSVGGVQTLEYIEQELEGLGEESSDEEEDDDDDDDDSKDVVDGCGDEDEEEEEEMKVGDEDEARSTSRGKGGGRLSKTTAVARMATINGIALHLRNHLKDLYNLTEGKCQKYDPAKKATSGADKQAVRKSLAVEADASLRLAGLPGAFDIAQEGDTEHCQRQMASFEELMRQDGALAEPDKDFDWDD